VNYTAIKLDGQAFSKSVCGSIAKTKIIKRSSKQLKFFPKFYENSYQDKFWEDNWKISWNVFNLPSYEQNALSGESLCWQIWWIVAAKRKTGLIVWPEIYLKKEMHVCKEIVQGGGKSCSIAFKFDTSPFVFPLGLPSPLIGGRGLYRRKLTLWHKLLRKKSKSVDSEPTLPPPFSRVDFSEQQPFSS